MRRVPRLSTMQRYRLEAAAKGFLRFGATVVCSALLAAWFLDPHASWRRWANQGLRKTASLWRQAPAPRPTVTSAALATPAAITRAPGTAMTAQHFGERYARYFEEAMPLLRGDAKVRMVSIEMPSGILGYQQNSAATVAGFRLATIAHRIPVVAISRNAREFLSTMRITFVDPKTLPEETQKRVSLPMTWESLTENYVLVPDLSPVHAKQFLFTRR